MDIYVITVVKWRELLQLRLLLFNYLNMDTCFILAACYLYFITNNTTLFNTWFSYDRWAITEAKMSRHAIYMGKEQNKSLEEMKR